MIVWRLAIGLPLLALVLGTARPGAGAGPILVTGAGDPVIWGPGPIPFNPDQGTLGLLDNALAVAAIADNFAVWTAVPTANVSVANAGSLAADVTPANFASFFGCNGLSPIIFDTDGTIIDYLFGAGASDGILGFATLECASIDGTTLTVIEGLAVLNGKFIDGVPDPEVPLATFNGVFVHEFGHYLGLDHSQVNLAEAFDDDPGNDEAVATMFPVLQGADFSTLHLDDRVSLSTLYPAPAFGTDFGVLEGIIFRQNGLTPLQGAYVVARESGSPRLTAVGVSSGDRYFPDGFFGPPPFELKGRYRIPGLSPGSYTLEIEAIDPAFVGGSSVGPLSPPIRLPGPPEFWNDTNEAALDPPDDPGEAVPLDVVAGTTVGDVDVIINGSLPPTNAVTGLAAVAVYKHGSDGVEGIKTALAIAVSPDGEHVYAGGRALDELARFRRDAVTGTLTFEAVVRNGVDGVTGLRAPTTMAFSPGGAHLYVAGERGDVVAFARTPGTGALSFLGVVTDEELRGAETIVVSPDGSNLYGVSGPRRSLIAFSRNPATGLLTLLERHFDGEAGVDGLGRALGVAVSPDGKHVYATGRDDHAVVLFSRDLGTGALAFVRAYFDGDDGLDGLLGAASVAVSPDGGHVYVGRLFTGTFDPDGIGVFARDPTTGELTFLEDETGSIYLRQIPNRVTVSADGTRVYATTSTDGPDTGEWCVVALDRDEASGGLTFIGAEHLDEARIVVESPDGAHLYVASEFHANVVGSFRTTSAACTSAPKFGCRPALGGDGKLHVRDLLPPEALEQGDLEAGKRDKLDWRWQGGATVLGDLGDVVTGSDDVVFCLYDGSVAPQPVHTALVQASGVCGRRPCWKGTGSSPGALGARFADRTRKPHGISKVKIREGVAPGDARILLRAQGSYLPMPLLPLQPPVVAQLQAATGECWESTFSTPDRNDPDEFEAASD